MTAPRHPARRRGHPAAKPTVFIVDDDQAVRSALRWLIESAGLPVRGYGSAEEFLDAFDPEHPGCLVLDIRLPGMSGIELQRHLNLIAAVIPIIVITGHADVETAVRALKTGAVEFIEKPLDEADLLEKIRDALELDSRNRRANASRQAVRERLDTLTRRERQTLDRVLIGKLNKQIAGELGLSEKTVESHRANVMRKMKARSLAELVRLVARAEEDA